MKQNIYSVELQGTQRQSEIGIPRNHLSLINSKQNFTSEHVKLTTLSVLTCRQLAEMIFELSPAILAECDSAATAKKQYETMTIIRRTNICSKHAAILLGVLN